MNKEEIKRCGTWENVPKVFKETNLQKDLFAYCKKNNQGLPFPIVWERMEPFILEQVKKAFENGFRKGRNTNVPLSDYLAKLDNKGK